MMWTPSGCCSYIIMALSMVVSESKYIMCVFYSGPLHRERRRYLRTAINELISLFSDSPGLLGPKV